jgi:hypothetical protein
LDLIIGERGGRIQYFHNKATGPIASYSSAATSDFLGGVDVMPACCTGYNVPFMTPIDSTGDYYLFVGSEEGVVQLFGDVENNLSGTFTPVDTAISGLDFGERSSISGADINNDGIMELVVGNYRGGVSMMSITGTAVISIKTQIIDNIQFTVFPNPTSDMVYFYASNQSSYQIQQVWVYDCVGKIMVEKTGKNIASLDIGTLQPGIYILKVVLGDHFTISRKIIRS